jgi:hypothetical protein
MTDPANRGKEAEHYVQKYLEAYDRKVARFDWKRNHDAHTAGGRFPRQTGDFEFFLPQCYGVIEVKEVLKGLRLPAKNFGGLPKVKKRQLAGGKCYVIVWFRTANLWCISDLEPYAVTAPSWDLSGLTQYESAEAALGSLGLFV